MNTIFMPCKFTPKADRFSDEMLPEMAKQFTRWGRPFPVRGFIACAGHATSREFLIDFMKPLMNNNPGIAHSPVQNQFNLVKQVTEGLTVDFSGVHIRISTVIPYSLSRNGIYFEGVP